MYQNLLSFAQNFLELTEDELLAFKEPFKVKKVPKGHFLLQDGQVSDKVFFIDEGILREYYYVENENDIERTVTTWILPQNHFTYSLISYLTQSVTNRYIEAIENSRVLYIQKDELEKLCQRVPKIYQLINKVYEYYLLVFEMRLEMLRIVDAKQRYEYFLSIHPDISNRVPLHHIASYLNIHPTTLSRVRSQLSNE